MNAPSQPYTYSSLHRYWFMTNEATGYGVTAFSLDDAWNILALTYEAQHLADIQSVIEDVDVSLLDDCHIRRNSGPACVRGIWHAFLNLSELVPEAK
jgi:regulatory protein YycH of two-component signal transduction system YycFG